MRQEDQMKAGAVVMGIIAFSVVILTMLSLCGCTTIRHVPVESVRTEYRDNVGEVHTTDSATDIRFVYVKGDTVIDWRDRVKWKERIVRDSIYIERVDSISVPYPVEKPLTRWQQTKMDFGGMALGGVAVAVCIAVVWLIKKIRK